MAQLHSQRIANAQIREGVLTGILLVLTGGLSAWFSSVRIALLISGIAVLLFTAAKVRSYRLIGNVIFWYDNLLDSIPFPLSVTDTDMNWTFINKPVESMLGTKRKDVVGKRCSNWGAGICGSRDCGINCLRRGQNRTTFEQAGLNFQVDVAYLLDRNGETEGHIEVVQDISKIIEMQRAESQLAGEMSELMGKIDGTCAVFIDNIDAIAEDINAMSQSSLTQSQAVDELSSSITGISDQIAANSLRTAEATSLAQNIKDGAQDASLQMSDMVQAVREISDAAKAIEKIIKVINDIAYQTNILALNAAVEAARAGEHGKGFAVVAEEVHNLASKSAEAAKNTSRLIANSIEKSALGENIASETASSLEKIIDKIQLSSQSIAQIDEASDNQRDIVKNIQSYVEHVAQIAQHNHETAQQSVSESQSLKEHTRELKDLLEAFENKRGVQEFADS